MTIDLANATTAGRDASNGAAASGASSSAPAAGAKAFGQVMAEAFGPNGQAHTTEAQDGSTDKAEASAASLDGTEAGQNPADLAQGMDAQQVPAWMQVQAMTQTLAVQPVTPGSSLQLITTRNPAPDDASLIAFAQTQGLDAHTIAMLLGKPTATGAAMATGDGLPMAGLALSGATLNAANPLLGQSLGATLNGAATGATLTATALAGEGAPTASTTLTPGANQLPNLQALTGLQTAGTAQANLAAAGAAGTAAPGDAQALSAAAAAAAVLRAAGAPTTQSQAKSGLSLSGDLPSQPAELSGLEQGMVLTGLRRTLLGATGTTNATTAGANWTFAAQQAAQQAAQWSESELDLSDAFPGEGEPIAADSPLAGSPLLQDAPSPKEISPPTTGLSGSGHTQPKTEAQAAASAGGKMASDQMQQLGEQMADAIGERMMREIERGQWNLRLMLKPAHLGHIEVEMRLHAGGLDASFTAPHAATRDLLQDGLDKLKDSLSQAGMDIANLDVKTGQNHQNGEDPTPGQSASVATPSSKDSPDSPAQATGFTPRPRRPDGWDVMV